MSHTEELALIAKRDGGISAICKHVIERRGSSSITEHELTKLISDNVERRPGETREQAFCRAFEAPDAEGLAMRKAVAVLRHHPVAEAAPRSVAGGTVSGDAYGKLLAKAEEARRADPSLTREQSFAKIYADPANVELARAERAANRPHA